MLPRRDFLRAASVLALASASGGCLQASPPPARPLVSGPVTGGRFNRPFGAFLGDLAEMDYVEEEYFLSGDAERYQPAGALGPDGKWKLDLAGTSPYRTRLVVRRPRDAARFNGTVILEWINVTIGFDLLLVGTHRPSFYGNGFAYVAVSCQKVGIDGFAVEPQGLKQWDPERYGSLSLPEESLCYDIFTQAARAVGPGRPKDGIDPLAGLAVKHVIGTGASQSAIRLRAYINAVHPRSRVFDAFLPLLDFGTALGFDNYVYDYTVQPSGEEKLFANKTRIRDDLDVPVMVVNSQSETLSYYPSRQPDTDRFRFWEIAGASHDPAPSLRRLQALLKRDQTKFQITEIKGSEVEWGPTADIAFLHMHRWLSAGTLPPRQPLIDVTENARISLDAFGNATGGIRLPEVEVPVATYSFKPELDLEGRTVPFASQRLAELYPDAASYARKVDAAAARAEAAGVIPPWRRQEYADTAANGMAGKLG